MGNSTAILLARIRMQLLVLLGVLLLLTACGRKPVSPAETPDNRAWLTIRAGAAEDAAAKDIEEALQASRQGICQQLQINCDFPVTVEIYPSQADFDQQVMNPEYRGYYALSGQGKIQMVSPRIQPAGREIPYEQRVQIAVHEYIHLALDQIDPELPAWLDEGTAIFLGPHSLYDQVCQTAFPFDRVPPFERLATAYDQVQSPDLFAYTAAGFIVQRYGLEKLNRLLRRPDDLAGVLGDAPDVFEKLWLDFLHSQYGDLESKPRQVHDPSFGWSTTVPAGWVSCDVPGGRFSRGMPLTDPTKLIIWTYFDRTSESVLAQLEEEGGVTNRVARGELDTPALQWARYAGDVRSDPDLAVEFALAARSTDTHLVLMLARKAELEPLVDTVLLPAVENFTSEQPDSASSVLAISPPAPEYWPTRGWRTAIPESQGMDGAKLDSLVALIRQESLPVDSITVIRHGYIVLDRAFPPYRTSELHELHSVTKSITSSLVGIALDDRELPVETPLLELLSPRRPAGSDARKQAMTLEHLLTMTAGLDWTEWDAAYSSGTGNDLVTMVETAPDWTQYILDQPMQAQPGEKFLYNSGASYLLSAAVSRLTGKPAADFAAERLFAPLGIRAYDWPAGPEGVTTGWGNLRLRPEDLARIGFLYLQRGVWEGRQIIPAEWVEASTTDWVADPAYEYGYQWWLDAADGYAYMSGRFGQTVIVAPRQDMVIVITASFPETDAAALAMPRWLAEAFILP